MTIQRCNPGNDRRRPGAIPVSTTALALSAFGALAVFTSSVAAQPEAPPFAIDWSTLDGGGGPMAMGPFVLEGTIGQPEPAVMTSGTFQMSGGYWFAPPTSPPPPCYADCDGDTLLSIDDFICFQAFFALGDLYADCDGDAALSIDDFICFQTFFAIGC